MASRNKYAVICISIAIFLIVAWAGSEIGRLLAVATAVGLTAYAGYLIYKGTHNALNGILGAGLIGALCYAAKVYEAAGNVGAAIFGLAQVVAQAVLCIGLASLAITFLLMVREWAAEPR